MRISVKDLLQRAYLRWLCWQLMFIRVFSKSDTADKTVFVVFSKDRCVQLHCLLKSLFYHVRGDFEVHVLYSSSNPQHESSYLELQTLFSSQLNLRFYKQGTSFKKDLINIVSRLSNSNIFFLVDDIIFKGPLDLSRVLKINLRNQIFSLRHGSHLNYSYVVALPQKMPEVWKVSPETDLIGWNWRSSELDWAYPLSVDGHLFTLEDVRFWVEKLNYHSPNSFEHTLQSLRKAYMNTTGVCFVESVIFNNPCNRVQSEIDNRAGCMSASDLLELWNGGFEIDFLAFEGYKNTSVHEEVALTLKPRL